MLIDVNINHLKPNSVLVTDEKNVVHCIPIDIFKKDLNEIIDKNQLANDSLDAKYGRLEKKVDTFTKAIYEFLKIMKGVNEDEKK